MKLLLQSPQQMMFTCANGHLEIVQFLCQPFPLTVSDARADDNCPFRWSCHYGHMKVAMFLSQYFQLAVEDVLVNNKSEQVNY